MLQFAKPLLLASLLLGVVFAPANAAEREQVRIVVNLVAAVKMPYPENLARDRAKTQRVWLELNGATVACLRLEARRWCYEHIPPSVLAPRCCESATSLRQVYGGTALPLCR